MASKRRPDSDATTAYEELSEEHERLVVLVRAAYDDLAVRDEEHWRRGLAFLSAAVELSER